MMLTILLPFISFILAIGFVYVKTKAKSKFANTFPGPHTFPILGNVFNFTSNKPEAAKGLIDNGHSKFGNIFRIKILHNYMYMIADPQVYQIVFSDAANHLKKNHFYDFLRIWMGNGIVVSDGDYWRNHRRVIAPAFHYNMLEHFVEVFDHQSQILVEKLSIQCDNLVINIIPYLLRMAIDIVFETALGGKLSSQDMPDVPYLTATDDLSQIMSLRFYAIWRQSDFLYSIFGYKELKEMKKNIQIMHEFAETIIVERRNQLLKSMENSQESDPTSNRSKNIPFLDILLQAKINGQPLSNAEIHEEVNTFMFSGHGTSATAIALILWALSRHKEIQDKVFEEILLIVGSDKTTPVACNHLQEMKYLDLVIKETFRMYPIIPIIGRYLDKNVVLDDGRIIPADTNVFFNLYITFKDPKYFKNPDVFDPERFTDSKMKDVHPYAFTPFSSGNRNCIGQKYAMLELKTVVSKVVRYYVLEPRGEEPNIVFELVARSINGVQLGLSPRIY